MQNSRREAQKIWRVSGHEVLAQHRLMRVT
jgi:hypothetical protein